MEHHSAWRNMLHFFIMAFATLSSWSHLFAMAVKTHVTECLNFFVFHLSGSTMITDAYRSADGKPFQIVYPGTRLTLVSSQEHIREIGQAANDELSLHAAAKDMLKPGYTMAGFNWHDQRGIEGTGFVRSLRTLLTNYLPRMTPDVRGMLERGFTRELAQGEDSLNVIGLSTKLVTDICGFTFFGRDQMQDKVFMDSAYGYNQDVLLGAEILRLTPDALVPLVGKALPLWFNQQKVFHEGLMRMIEQRLAQFDSSERYNDVTQWIIDTAPKDPTKKWSASRISVEVMAIWFGSVQGLAITLTFALYNLCSHPEYIQPLREEIRGTEGAQFLITGEGLPLMDSFLKECSRWTPVESVTARRRALKDFRFSDGTLVRKGDGVSIPLGPMLRDNAVFPNPDVFDGFRFAKLHTKQPEGPTKFTDVNEKWQVWGVGKITCPGRFFVSYVMKHVFMYILENHEPSMVDAQGKKTFNWRTLTIPKPGVEIVLGARD